MCIEFRSTPEGRTPGGGDGYSEFLIVADIRPIDGVIAGKFGAIGNILSSNASVIVPAVLADLQQRIGQARGLYDQGAVGDLVNVAGALRVAADTLKFSLTWKSNGAQ